jgi:hypothetical protein
MGEAIIRRDLNIAAAIARRACRTAGARDLPRLQKWRDCRFHALPLAGAGRRSRHIEGTASHQVHPIACNKPSSLNIMRPTVAGTNIRYSSFLIIFHVMKMRGDEHKMNVVNREMMVLAIVRKHQRRLRS